MLQSRVVYARYWYQKEFSGKAHSNGFLKVVYLKATTCKESKLWITNIPWFVLCIQVDYRISEDRKTNTNVAASLVYKSLPGWGDGWRRWRRSSQQVTSQQVRQSISSPAVGRGCTGHVRGHGYPSACWGLQRSLWLNCGRAGDWAVPAGLRSCRWNLCVHFGRNFFFECCQQELLKINWGNNTEKNSLGNKLQNYLRFSNN